MIITFGVVKILYTEGGRLVSNNTVGDSYFYSETPLREQLEGYNEHYQREVTLCKNLLACMGANVRFVNRIAYDKYAPADIFKSVKDIASDFNIDLSKYKSLGDWINTCNINNDVGDDNYFVAWQCAEKYSDVIDNINVLLHRKYLEYVTKYCKDKGIDEKSILNAVLNCPVKIFDSVEELTYEDWSRIVTEALNKNNALGKIVDTATRDRDSDDVKLPKAKEDFNKANECLKGRSMSDSESEEYANTKEILQEPAVKVILYLSNKYSINLSEYRGILNTYINAIKKNITVNALTPIIQELLRAVDKVKDTNQDTLSIMGGINHYIATVLLTDKEVVNSVLSKSDHILKPLTEANEWLEGRSMGESDSEEYNKTIGAMIDEHKVNKIVDYVLSLMTQTQKNKYKGKDDLEIAYNFCNDRMK